MAIQGQKEKAIGFINVAVVDENGVEHKVGFCSMVKSNPVQARIMEILENDPDKAFKFAININPAKDAGAVAELNF